MLARIMMTLCCYGGTGRVRRQPRPTLLSASVPATERMLRAVMSRRSGRR